MLNHLTDHSLSTSDEFSSVSQIVMLTHHKCNHKSLVWLHHLARQCEKKIYNVLGHNIYVSWSRNSGIQRKKCVLQTETHFLSICLNQLCIFTLNYTLKQQNESSIAFLILKSQQNDPSNVFLYPMVQNFDHIILFTHVGWWPSWIGPLAEFAHIFTQDKCRLILSKYSKESKSNIKLSYAPSGHRKSIYDPNRGRQNNYTFEASPARWLRGEYLSSFYLSLDSLKSDNKLPGSLRRNL